MDAAGDGVHFGQERRHGLLEDVRYQAGGGCPV